MNLIEMGLNVLFYWTLSCKVSVTIVVVVVVVAAGQARLGSTV